MAFCLLLLSFSDDPFFLLDPQLARLVDFPALPRQLRVYFSSSIFLFFFFPDNPRLEYRRQASPPLPFSPCSAGTSLLEGYHFYFAAKRCFRTPFETPPFPLSVFFLSKLARTLFPACSSWLPHEGSIFSVLDPSEFFFSFDY